MLKKEIKAFSFEVRAEQDEEHGYYLAGRPIVYNQRTDMGMWDEIIEDGALTDTDLTDVRLLVNHNTDMIPLARSRNNNSRSTMQLSVVDGEGLDIRVNLDVENNTDARSLWSAVGRGDLTGMSFMFSVDGEDWTELTEEHPTRHITRIDKVFEVSAVTFPAYTETYIQQRGLAEALESAEASLESARAELRSKENKKKKIRILMEV